MKDIDIFLLMVACACKKGLQILADCQEQTVALKTSFNSCIFIISYLLLCAEKVEQITMPFPLQKICSFTFI